MTNTISVPRDLLIDVRDSTNEAGNLSYRQHHIDHHRRLTRKLDELLEAPAVEVEGMHPLIKTLRVDVAQQKVIIDQQAARIAELQKDADRYRWLRHMTTKERTYIVQQEYDKVMDMFLDESMKGGRNE